MRRYLRTPLTFRSSPLVSHSAPPPRASGSGTSGGVYEQHIRYTGREQTRGMGRQEYATTWSTEEKRELLKLQSIHRNQWLVLSGIMKRTPASVRNCFQRIDPNRERVCRNLCKRCGEYARGHVCSRPYDAVHLKLRGNTRSKPYDAVKVKLRGSEVKCVPPVLDFVFEYSHYVKPHLFSLSEMEQELLMYWK